MLMMLPFEAPTIFEGIHKSYFRMPRVVKDQRSRFENDDLFRQLSHESEVKYTGFKDRPVEERQMKFIANCEEGHTEVSVVQSGNQFTLMFNPAANPEYNNEGCDFNKELGKVHIKAGFILNGVCVLWTGWIDLQRLEGFGRLEFDEYRAYLEEAMTKQQLDSKQCNNNSQISRLNHHMGPMLPPQSSFNQAAAAAAAVAAITTNTMLPPPPLGLNANCLGQPHPNSLSPGANSSQLISSLTAPPPPPPVSLADSAAAAHYGNAAIAAAAAAAFHQALSVGGGGGLPPPPHQQSLHPLSGAGVGGPAPSTLAAVAASNGLHCQPPPPPPHSLVPPHLTYTNGSHMIPSLQSAPPQQHQNTSPHLHTSPQHHNPHHHHPHHHSLNGSQTNGSPGTIQHHISSNQMRSPERENHHQHHHHQHHHNNNNNNNGGGNNNNHFSKRQAIKRPQEEQTQIDEVDVVSDISAHDLDFPPKRIFKSDSMTSHHNHHHKISRRAA